MAAIVCLSILSVVLGVCCWINGMNAEKLQEYTKMMNEENDELKHKIEALTDELNRTKKESDDAAAAYREERIKMIQEHTKHLNDMRATLEKAKQDEEDVRLIKKYFMRYNDDLLF